MFISKKLSVWPYHSSYHYVISLCPASGKYLQGFPRVCLRKMTPLQQPQQSLTSSSPTSGAWAAAHMQEITWVKCWAESNPFHWRGAVTHSSYTKEKLTQQKWLTVMQGWEGGGRKRKVNPLNHSFMSVSLFNETQRRFLMRKCLCAAGRQSVLQSAKRGQKRPVWSEKRGDKKTFVNSSRVGMLS